MEEAEAKQQLAPLLGLHGKRAMTDNLTHPPVMPLWTHLVATLKECGVGDWVVEVRAKEVGSQSLGRFIGHLYPCAPQ